MMNAAERVQVDFQRLWNIIQVKRWTILTVTLAFFTLSAVYSFRQPDRFTATCKILIENIESTPLQSDSTFGEMLRSRIQNEITFYRTQLELLRGRGILEDTVRQLSLVAYYGRIYPGLKTERQAVMHLDRQIKTKVLGGTKLVQLSVTDRDPKMASEIANRIAENFLKESFKSRLYISEQLLKWFPDQAKTLQENSPAAQLQRLENADFAETLPSVMNDPVIQKIKEERLKIDSEIRELSRRYTELHPKMKELYERAKYVESEMEAQKQKILSSVKAGLAGTFNVSNVRIVENALPPLKPSGPRRLLMIVVMTGMGFGFSFFYVMYLKYLDRNVKTEDDLGLVPGLPFLGYVPLVTQLSRGEDNESESLLQVLINDTPLIDMMTNIRTAVLFSLPAERSKYLMCTSAIPNEGKTTVTSMLGISIARMGERVLLIDTDMRKSSLHKLFGLTNGTGFSDCVIGSARWQDAVREIDLVPGLSVMTAGSRTPNPTALLNSQSLHRLISELGASFDRILFDAPPSLHIPDGLILAERMHGVIMVLGSGMVHYNIARKIKNKFSVIGPNLLIGAIINRTDIKKVDYEYSYYYKPYHRYYHKAERQGAPTPV